MSVKFLNTVSAVMFEAIKRNAADRLCSIAITVCVGFGHKIVSVYEPASRESESTWYDMSYSDFDIIRDICSIAFDVVNLDVSVSGVDGYNVYRIYGIESEV